ncbi:hypothetical protein PRIPAC_91683 [Pristionchus pacificus]|nr:hypothetical protein PRIPAC_91683 [Pristionchus pacificus]
MHSIQRVHSYPDHPIDLPPSLPSPSSLLPWLTHPLIYSTPLPHSPYVQYRNSNSDRIIPISGLTNRDYGTLPCTFSFVALNFSCETLHSFCY